MRAFALSSRLARGLWQIGLPGLLAVLSTPLLAPAVASAGFPRAVSAFGRSYPVLFLAIVFLALSAIAHYWEPRVLGPSPPRGRRGASAEAIRLGLGVALVALSAWTVRRLFFAPYVVVGPSMLPTLEPNDYVAGRPSWSAGRRPPARGDVVAFRGDALGRGASGPWPEVLVKRVIGLPGDQVSMRGNSPVVNGWPVPNCDAGEYIYLTSDEPRRSVHGRLRVEYLDDRVYLTVHTPGPVFDQPYVVPPGQVFVLGDNRGNSADSRSFGLGHGGGVPLAALDANVRWFLVGTHRSGSADLGRVLAPIDALATHVRLEGLGVEALQEGIAKCLASRPALTHAPPPADPSTAGLSPLDFGKAILGIGMRSGGSARSTVALLQAFPDDLRDLRTAPHSPPAWSVP
jgi:signal peptidase I